MDIIFDYEDVFNKNLKCGIQVKLNSLNATELIGIMGQLCVAFGHEYSIKPNKGLLDIVYIVTNGNITQASREYINASNVGFRNVRIIDGNQLNLLLELDTRKLDYNN
ncbi:MAG: hypothetical protein ACYDAS_00105 [Patescibacteria group bacterium]